MTNWIKHDSEAPPQLAPATLIRLKCPEGGKSVLLTVWDVDWLPGVIYSLVTDDHGRPCISAKGLEPWAEYVATERPNQAFQYNRNPKGLAPIMSCLAPDTYIHPGHWKDSLMRVWRD